MTKGVIQEIYEPDDVESPTVCRLRATYDQTHLHTGIGTDKVEDWLDKANHSFDAAMKGGNGLVCEASR